MKKISAVIFDMDGVILDSETVCDRTWTRLAKEMNLPNIEKAMHDCRGTNKTDTYLILKEMYGKDFDVDYFMQKSSDYFHEIEFSEGLNLLPDVIETLKYLKTKYKIGLSTSTKKETASRQLKNANVFDFFDGMVFGDMVVHSKPDPEIYIMAAKAVGENPQNCAAIEDSPNGIRSAYKAGLAPIMVPDKIMPDDEMKQLCWKIGAPLSMLKEWL